MSEKNSVFKNNTWYSSLTKEFWRNPNRLTASKVMIAMVIQAIPAIIWGSPFMMVTLSLGTVASALSETDDHPRGRFKALAITLVSFAVTTLSVSILKPYPIVFGIGFICSTMLFVLIGGISERYRGISYGAVLIGIYAMLSYQKEYEWYQQSLFLCSGALFYGLLSLFLLYKKPWRLLDEQLSSGFMALSGYLEEKAKNFPFEITKSNNKQAILNIQVVSALEKCKEVINIYGQEIKDQKLLIPYLQRFMLLQSLHERAASGHEKYDKLSEKVEYKELLEGFTELFYQLSHATKLVAETTLTGEKYQHPVSLSWIVNALEFEIEKLPDYDKQLLELLLHNLTRSHESLKNLNQPEKSTSIPRLGQDNRSLWTRFKDQFTWQHPRLRYAIRLSSCFLIGYLIVQHFQLVKGEWIMLTSLFVSQPTYSETRRKLIERIFGTLAGVALGLLTLELLPTMGGQMILIVACGFFFFYYRHLNYSYAVIFISIFVLAGNQLAAEQIENVFIPRILDTIAGASLSFLVIRLLWPNWQHKHIPLLLSDALKKNAAYFSEIIKIDQPENDDYNYRLARRLAHKSDNALTLAWQSMQVEPKKRRHIMDQAFKLTYLNHALISHLSALGALHDDHGHLIGFDWLETEIISSLNEASKKLCGEGDQLPNKSLKPILVKLKNIIDDNKPNIERQQLRVIYNIAAVCNKLLKESQATINYYS